MCKCINAHFILDHLRKNTNICEHQAKNNLGCHTVVVVLLHSLVSAWTMQMEIDLWKGFVKLKKALIFYLGGCQQSTKLSSNVEKGQTLNNENGTLLAKQNFLYPSSSLPDFPSCSGI